jgi:hypothetical protein
MSTHTSESYPSYSNSMIRVVATLIRAIAEHHVIEVKHGAVQRRLEPQALGNSPSSGPVLLAWERSPQPGWRFLVAAEFLHAVCLPERFGVRNYPDDCAAPVACVDVAAMAASSERTAPPVAASERAPGIRMQPRLVVA